MRSLLAFALVSSVLLAATDARAMSLAPLKLSDVGLQRVEYYCSPGFEPRGGSCVAVPSRAEIELYVDQPIYGGDYGVRRRYRHRRRGLRERF